MTTSTVVVALPPDLVAAVDAEARRRLLRRGEVLAAFLRDAWPSWVQTQLERDLARTPNANPAVDETAD